MNLHPYFMTNKDIHLAETLRNAKKRILSHGAAVSAEEKVACGEWLGARGQGSSGSALARVCDMAGDVFAGELRY